MSLSEKNQSESIDKENEDIGWYFKKDVKAFIKELKDSYLCDREMSEEIDKLAGKELI